MNIASAVIEPYTEIINEGFSLKSLELLRVDGNQLIKLESLKFSLNSLTIFLLANLWFGCGFIFKIILFL